MVSVLPWRCTWLSHPPIGISFKEKWASSDSARDKLYVQPPDSWEALRMRQNHWWKPLCMICTFLSAGRWSPSLAMNCQYSTKVHKYFYIFVLLFLFSFNFNMDFVYCIYEWMFIFLFVTLLFNLCTTLFRIVMRRNGCVKGTLALSWERKGFTFRRIAYGSDQVDRKRCHEIFREGLLYPICDLISSFL